MAAGGEPIVFKPKLDRIPEHRAIKRNLMKTIVEIGFTVKSVSQGMVFITSISQVNGTGSAMVNSGMVNSTVKSTDINLHWLCTVHFVLK